MIDNETAEGINFSALWLSDRELYKQILRDNAAAYFKTPEEPALLEAIDRLIDDLSKDGPPEYVIADVVIDGGPGSINNLLCSDCPATCCLESNYISVGNGDLRAIAKYLGMPWKKCAKKHLRPTSGEFREWFYEKTKGKPEPWILRNVDPCEFLVDGRCQIYPVRPNGCRWYPLIWKKPDGYGVEIHQVCRYPLNIIISEIVGQFEPKHWKDPQPWMHFIRKRAAYTFETEGKKPGLTQEERIECYKKGNESIWRRVTNERRYDK
jgi:Fe-S-cluster containining protein